MPRSRRGASAAAAAASSSSSSGGGIACSVTTVAFVSALFGFLSSYLLHLDPHFAVERPPVPLRPEGACPPTAASVVQTLDASQLPLTPPPSSPRTTAAATGVAVTILLHEPNNPSNFVALLHNYLVNLPRDWRIKVITTPQAAPRLLSIKALARLVRTTDDGRGGSGGSGSGSGSRVDLVVTPPTHADLDRRQLLLSPWLWGEALAPAGHALVFDAATALCGSHAGNGVEDFLDWDWVGAAWKWAKPGTPHMLGGNGALSLRNRSLCLSVVEDAVAKQVKTSAAAAVATAKQQQQQPAPPAVERRYVASFKGNEDMWFVKELFSRATFGNVTSTATATSGTIDAKPNSKQQQQQQQKKKNKPEAAAELGPIVAGPRLAPRSVCMRWAVEELFEVGTAPMGVYHLMRSMSNNLRAKVLNYCPEAKRFFGAKHEVAGK